MTGNKKIQSPGKHIKMYLIYPYTLRLFGKLNIIQLRKDYFQFHLMLQLKCGNLQKFNRILTTIIKISINLLAHLLIGITT
jgi:hypothetical protein